MNCSWLCNDLQSEMLRRFGYQTNEYGLLGSLSAAARCVRAIECAAMAAEPGCWLPYGLVRYVP